VSASRHSVVKATTPGASASAIGPYDLAGGED
jgi:hypothetical protein